MSKIIAIEALGIGIFSKVYLGFPEVFWESCLGILAYDSDTKTVWPLMLNLYMQFGDNNPEPVEVRIPRWQQDPYAFGAYSFMKEGANRQSRRDLAETVDDKLYFAGEATNWDYPVTMHGALLSGLREAEKIRKL